MKIIALTLLSFYKQFISPFIPPACRFEPTCSEYMYQAIDKHGFIIGFLMGIKRILRCNPFCKGGYDPVN